ncbi:hypothetical protein [Collimonas pratensis]|uniref:hypothetical protein n=1 Tax=Collimonas pratensis TaxID=279113 RepID=UPI00078422DA|nr:hypothetical protein [Collimonas pratensis]
MSRLLVLTVLLLSNTLAVAQNTPPPNYESWGVCPFECCTYREWTADGEIAVHQDRNEKSAVVFQLRSGQPVDGVNGVVVAEKPGVIIVDRAIRDGYIKGSDQPQLSLSAGDVVYVVSPLGEGSYLFWYEGKIYQSGNNLAGMPGVDGRAAKMTWWKQVRNKSGKSGWTASDKFKNVDACG